MIVGNLVCGLGTQMFQYACARALALDLGQAVKFSTDGFGANNAHNGIELGRAWLPYRWLNGALLAAFGIRPKVFTPNIVCIMRKRAAAVPPQAPTESGAKP